jgi:hypothetical protein
MFSFTALLLVSIVLALIVVFIHRVVSDTRKSTARFKERVDVRTGSSDFLKSAGLHPAAPNERSVWESHGNGNRNPDHLQGLGAKAGHFSRDSLHDVTPPEPKILRDHAGPAYKVTRRVVPNTPDDQGAS